MSTTTTLTREWSLDVASEDRAVLRMAPKRYAFDDYMGEIRDMRAIFIECLQQGWEDRKSARDLRHEADGTMVIRLYQRS